MLKLFKNIRLKDIPVMLVCAGLIVLQVWLDLKLPKYMMEITTLLKTEGVTVGAIWEKGSYMLLCSVASMVSTIIVSFFVSRIAASFSKRLRFNIFNKIESFSLEQINRFSTASLITRTTNDVTQIQMAFAMGLQVLIKAPIMAVWAISDMSSVNWQCSIATAVAVAIMIITIAIAVVLALPKFKKMQSLTDNINKVTRENLEGVRVVRAYNAEKFEEKKFEKANDELTKTSIFTSRVMSIMSPMMNFVMSSLTLAIYFIGAMVISNTNILQRAQTFGNIMGFSSYAMQVVMAFMMITMVFIMLPRATVSSKRINEVLNEKTNIEDGEFDKETDTKGVIEFNNVSFKYPDADEYVLENINIKVQPGETVAFIGSTGSGKSTLINLVPRFYDVTDGEILVDGVNIKDYKLSTLRNKIGYISQKAVMFSGKVKDNLNFGDSGKAKQTDEELLETLSIACADDFVQNMENGLDSYISAGGTNVSGGQKQRLNIARALAKRPEILIFDDSFSALDYKTDKKLRRNLSDKIPNVTRLIVAQRVGTIIDADKIVVLDSGNIVGIGTHKQLLKDCEIYKEIALSQLSMEELNND